MDISINSKFYSFSIFGDCFVVFKELSMEVELVLGEKILS